MAGKGLGSNPSRPGRLEKPRSSCRVYLRVGFSPLLNLFAQFLSRASEGLCCRDRIEAPSGLYQSSSSLVFLRVMAFYANAVPSFPHHSPQLLLTATRTGFIPSFVPPHPHLTVAMMPSPLPVPAIQLLVSIFLPLQSASARLWGRKRRTLAL